MLDGRVLGASQVEYKPFGKPPLKKKKVASSKALQHKCHLCSIPAAPPPGIGATRQPAESYGSYGSYGHTVIRQLGTAPAAPARHRSLPGRATCPA